MHIRSQSIDLMPEIEQNCMTDLATCRNTDVKGEVSDERQPKRNEIVRLGNEMSAKEIQKIRGEVSNRGAKIHATDGERSDLGFSPDESLRTNDSTVLHRTDWPSIDFCLFFLFIFRTWTTEMKTISSTV